MTVAPIAARAVASGAGRSAATRAGAGKVIDVTPTSSKGLRRPAAGRASDVATGAGAGQLLDGGSLKRGARAAGDLVAPPSQARKLLVAEFTLCMVVLAFSPLTDKHREEKPGAFMKRASATMGVFFILGLIATAGRGPARAAAGFGGLVALVLLISQRSIFTVLTTKLGKDVGEDDPDLEGAPDDDPSTGGVVGRSVGDALDDIDEVLPLPRLGPVGNGIR